MQENMLLPHAKSYRYKALVLFHVESQRTLLVGTVNQAFAMMHLLGKVMDINIMSMGNCQSLP